MAIAPLTVNSNIHALWEDSDLLCIVVLVDLKLKLKCILAKLTDTLKITLLLGYMLGTHLGTNLRLLSHHQSSLVNVLAEIGIAD